MSFLAPLYLLLLSISIPILLLWFLRQKRENLEVPTIFLWRRAAQEERVSPLLRNLTKSLLLLLQLLALLLLALGAAEAVLNLGLEGRARRVILLLDHSASMGMREKDGTRLDLARERIRVLLTTFRSGDQGMLVMFDESARVLSGFTADEDALLRLLEDVRPADLDTDPAAALDLAEAASAALPEGLVEVFLFSDGAFGALPEIPPGLADAKISFVGVGKETENVGIVDVSVDTLVEGAARAFVRVANTGTASAERTLSLLRDGSSIDAAKAELEPRSQAGAAFDLSEFGPGAYELVLTPGDGLAADDRAWFVIHPDPLRKLLLVTPGNAVLGRLKDFHPGLEVYAVTPDEFEGVVTGAEGRFDLTIFDGTVPAGARPGEGALAPSAVYLGCAPEEGELSLLAEIEDPVLVDWDRDHPLNRNVDWREVRVARSGVVAGVPEATALLETTAGPLVVALPGAGTRVVCGFRLEDSNLSLRLAFPIFFTNLLDAAFRQGGEAGYLPTGAVLSLPLPRGAEEAVIVDPEGRETPLARLPDGTIAYSATERAGLYTLRIGEQETPVAVTFLSLPESAVAPRSSIEIGGEERASDPASVETNLPLRTPLLLAALACLLLEWFLWLRGSSRRSLAGARA